MKITIIDVQKLLTGYLVKLLCSTPYLCLANSASEATNRIIGF